MAQQTPAIEYRSLETEERLNFNWDEYNAMSIWESGKWGFKNPEASKYALDTLKRERLGITADTDLKQAVAEIKEEKQAEREIKQQEHEAKLQDQNKLTCKKCGGHEFQLAGDNSKKYSFGKSVAGSVGLGVMTGGLGFIAGGAVGFAGKKGKKNTFVCLNCGKTMEIKK